MYIYLYIYIYTYIYIHDHPWYIFPFNISKTAKLGPSDPMSRSPGARPVGWASASRWAPRCRWRAAPVVAAMPSSAVMGRWSAIGRLGGVFDGFAYGFRYGFRYGFGYGFRYGMIYGFSYGFTWDDMLIWDSAMGGWYVLFHFFVLMIWVYIWVYPGMIWRKDFKGMIYGTLKEIMGWFMGLPGFI